MRDAGAGTDPRDGRRGALGAVLTALALLVLSAGALAADGPKGGGGAAGPRDTTPSPTPCGSFQVVRSPNVNHDASGLQGVAVAGSSGVSAVGGVAAGGTSNQTLTEHWDGTAWTVVPSPSGSGQALLSAVAAAGPADVWAVGQAEPTAHYETLTEHWNGTAWSIVPSANSGTSGDTLGAVAVAGPSDVWAAGSYYDSGATRYATLIEHWNGTAWTVVPSPNSGTGDNYLYGLTVAGSGDVWAVGSSWAPPRRADSGRALERQRLDDRAQPQLRPPRQRAGHRRRGRAGRRLAAGSSLNDSGTHVPLIEHWDGTAWTVVPSPAVGSGDNFLYGLTVLAPGDAWAVGHATVGSSDVTLALHWDGTAWTPAATPNPANNDNYFVAVGAAASGDVWAVGGQSTRARRAPP